MSKRDDLVVWMNQPSHYQTVFFRTLTDRGITLHVYYAAGMTQKRRDLGWEDPGSERYSQRKLLGSWDALKTAWRSRNAVHMINGLWSVPAFLLVAIFLLTAGARVYFHAERPNPATQREGLWLCLKRLWVRILFNHAEGLFAIGDGAARFYRDMGVPSNKIIRFMYFNQPSSTKVTKDNSKFVVTYVGQFIDRKRVGDLIEAFGQLAGERPDVQLRLIGSGPLGKSYLEQALARGLGGRVEVIGPLSPQEVEREIQRGHVLVLPSEFDGWGLTVNEALQAGVPAICSDGCGVAEILIDNPGWGMVYPKGNVSALISALRKIASDYGKFMPHSRQVAGRIGPGILTDLFIVTTMNFNIEPKEL